MYYNRNDPIFWRKGNVCINKMEKFNYEACEFVDENIIQPLNLSPNNDGKSDDKFNELFSELMNMLDWFDDDDDGTVEDGEKMIRFSLTRRTRGRRATTRVR